MKYWLLIGFVFFGVCTLFAQPDRAEVRKGNRDYSRGEYGKAVIDYLRAIEKDTASVAAHYNLNNTRYRQELYEEAEKGLKAKIETITDQLQRADAFHNLGNMQLKQKKYAESIDSYKDALRLRPGDMETKSNLAYAQKMLDNQDQDNQDNQDDQDQNDQDNQDQNQDRQDQPQDQKEQEAPPKITPQDARQMLEAMQQKEKETQDKVNKEKVLAVPPPSGKNW